MSFITKRERVFDEYDFFDLPARNEGKLKNYASCTDTRAWSHFGSDQTEHLVDIIKRNNKICRIKYVPTDVIVNTLMVAKNAEIGRLKRKIEEFEQMLAAYDQLDLTSEQKIEIANAHAAIKVANKELDDLCLDLDMSGFTEGIDSEAFETGKSRGDEPARFGGDEIDRLRADDGIDSEAFETGKSRGDEPARFGGDEIDRLRGDDWIYEKQPNHTTSEKSNQINVSCLCDASTNVHDPRIQQMQDTIIRKDAKLNAMQNTIAVMENDVCEPYCIYAHIYTALEKIFGILCQNDKYKLYLTLMTAGKDIQCIDIKGKILFKLKVLEKFSLALIAPCSQEPYPSNPECSCYRVEINQRVESTFALTSSESQQPCLDNKRAHLVADIMENEEMKKILSKEIGSDKMDDDQSSDNIGVDNYDIETENLKRLKTLQTNYDDLVTCYENIKHDKDCLQIKCQKYEELEKDYEILRNQLREYNLLWNEKEHYRKRSEGLDSLKEQCLILTDETTNLETQLKAESEINHIKTNTIADLRNENILLDKKFNEALISFEKEKNSLHCKLKETECKVMCQEQQIQSLSLQLDRLLEQDKIQPHADSAHSILLMDEIESLKDQIKNLNNALYCNQDEKHTLQEEFQEKLKDIHELRMTVEDWKSMYEKSQQRNNYLEKYAHDNEDELHKLIEENRSLSQELQEKEMDVFSKSQEIKKLKDEIANKKNENDNLFKQLSNIQQVYDRNIVSLENERKQALQTLDIARKESQELLSKVKDYDDMVQKQDNISKRFEVLIKKYNELNNDFLKMMEENTNLQMEIKRRENNNSFLLKEIQRLRKVNSKFDGNDFDSLHDEQKQYRASLELTRKESEILENLFNLSEELHISKCSHERLLIEKKKLEIELREKTLELANTIQCAQISKKESQDFSAKLQQSQNVNEELEKVNAAYKNILNDNRVLENQLSNKSKELNDLLQSLNNLQQENDNLLQQSGRLSSLQQAFSHLQKAHDDLITEKEMCKRHLKNKTDEIDDLNNILKNKMKENTDLLDQIKCLENNQEVFNSNLTGLQNENVSLLATLDAIKSDSSVLIDKVKQYESLENDFEQLRQAHDQLKTDKERLQNELDMKLSDLMKLKLENNELHRDSQTLLRHNENLEQLISKSDASHGPYSTIIKEIENLKQEKQFSHRRIGELLDTLASSDEIICNLKVDVLARDNKIAILENHINELEDEIRQLHVKLAQVVDAGELIQKSSYEKIDQSLKNMQAHHSRATHNMKMELVKLQNEKSILEDELSATKLKTEESAMDKHNYLSQIQNEKEIIVTYIKDLELESVGDSNLSPENYSVEDILMSLDRIRKIFDAKNSKNNVLEQTLLKVQTSSQLLLNEAKGIVEKEKQKILSEKEEAILDKLNMQKQLDNQKAHLEKQISLDKTVIKDLEGEIFNQKLLIDKLNKTTQIYITKLEEELRTLQTIYENSIATVSELQEKLLHSSEETNRQSAIIENINLDLELKSKEIIKLQNSLEELRNKPRQNYGIQVSLPDVNKANTASQTDKDLKDSEFIISHHIYDNNLKDMKLEPVIGGAQPDKPIDAINVLGVLPEQKPVPVNDVQILTANVDPSFDFVRSNYLKFKLKQLGPGRLEQYSVLNDKYTNENNDGQYSTIDAPNINNIYAKTTTGNPNLINIFNGQSSNSSRAVYKDTEMKHGPTKSSLSTELKLINDSFLTDTNTSKYRNGSSSENSTDNDFFIIYKDSKPSDKTRDDEELWNTNGQSEVLIESMTEYSQKKVFQTNKYDTNNSSGEKSKTQFNVYYEEKNTDSVKPKLHINLPRVVTDSLPITTPESEKKSLDSHTTDLYSNQSTFSDFNVSENCDKMYAQDTPSLPTLLKDDNQYGGTSKSLKHRKNENKIGLNSKIQKSHPLELNRRKIRHPTNKINTQTLNQSPVNESHHSLSRVEADWLKQNIRLQYILNTVQREIDPEGTAPIILRKTRSDERFGEIKPRYIASSSSQSPPLKLSSFEYRTDNTYSPTASITNKKSKSKTVVDRSIMAKIDNTHDYESKINHLTKALENTEKEYKKKIEAIKIQYDNNIKNIINEHNKGVKSLQNLHEETIQDVIKIHENEVDNLRSLSIEAMLKSDKLEKENRSLKSKIQICICSYFNEETFKMPIHDLKKRKKSRVDATLTKTNVEVFNVNPKSRAHGPCTCSPDVNVSDTIRNIFEQVDVEQKKMAEHAYMKYIVEKIVTENVEALDTQELSFLHLKVCRTWKMKMYKEEAIYKGITTLKHEVINKQRNAHQYIAELERQVAEEKRRLQEVREAVCLSPTECNSGNPKPERQPRPPSTVKNDSICNYYAGLEIGERQSAGDLLQPGAATVGFRPRRIRKEGNRAVLARSDVEERREKRLYSDEPPTRLRRAQGTASDRKSAHTHKK